MTDTLERDLQVGISRLREQMFNLAELIFLDVLAKAPGHPVATRHLGIARVRLGDAAGGVDLLRAVAGSDAGAWCDLAVALRDDGQGAAATEAHAQALALQPGLMALADLAFSTERATHAFTLVDYPYVATIRHGAGRPSHPELAAIIGAGRPRYEAFLSGLGEIADDLAQIPLGGNYESAEPFWLNSWFSGLDAMALTQMLRAYDPPRFVEIGSGLSTKFARRAVTTYGLRTKLVSIDPQPRSEVDGLCDQVIRKPLERCDMAMFEGLNAGDILFLDSSHRAFQGSDVTVFFLEILPRLKPGVIIHIHDIYLPDDYVGGHVWRLWNEQYLLATALLFGGQAFEILFPSWFASQDPALKAQARAAVCKGPLARLDLYGASFWMTKT